MSLSEMLQHELWSRATTQQYLVPVGHFLNRTALVLEIVLVLAALIYGVESQWLTGGERKAAREVLAEIEKIDTPVTNAGQAYEAENQRAGMLVDRAEQAAWTVRDHQIVSALKVNLDMVHMEHNRVVRDEQFKQMAKDGRLNVPTVCVEQADSTAASMETHLILRASLHEMLD